MLGSSMGHAAMPLKRLIFAHTCCCMVQARLGRRKMLALGEGPVDIAEPKTDVFPFTELQGKFPYSTGTAEVPLAVIDTGCDIDHPDLLTNIWKNPCKLLLLVAWYPAYAFVRSTCSYHVVDMINCLL